MKKTLTTLVMSLMLVGAAAAVPGEKGGNYNGSPVTDRSLDHVVISEVGYLTLSADGLGMLVDDGFIQVEKPSAGATVRGAYFMSVKTGGNWGPIADGCVTLDGVGVTWDASATHPYPFSNHFADVTAILAPTLNAAPAGIIDVAVHECSSSAIDGSALYVIFDDPETTFIRTAVVQFGSQNLTGDSFYIGFGAPVQVDANTVIEMGLGISYGYQVYSCQTSEIDVNGTRMTSIAGGHDDGTDANGALLTVGGIGDSRMNPADPFHPCVGDITFIDDELYDIAGYVNSGDVGVTVDTINPSDNDNIFSAHLLIDFAAVIGEGALLTPAYDVSCIGEDHTLLVTLQDNAGAPVVGRDVVIDIVAGPNMGLTSGVLVTDGMGQASFSYASTLVGTDSIVASFLDSAGAPQTSNTALEMWEDCAVVSADDLPESFSLMQNHPNPFNPTTTIEFTLEETAYASLLVYSVDGKLIADLVHGLTSNGTHTVAFDASGLSSGVYFYTLSVEGVHQTRKMVLMK